MFDKPKVTIDLDEYNELLKLKNSATIHIRHQVTTLTTGGLELKLGFPTGSTYYETRCFISRELEPYFKNVQFYLRVYNEH